MNKVIDLGEYRNRRLQKTIAVDLTDIPDLRIHEPLSDSSDTVDELMVDVLNMLASKDEEKHAKCICVAKCPENDYDNSPHCVATLESIHEREERFTDYCPCGNNAKWEPLGESRTSSKYEGKADYEAAGWQPD